MKKDNTEAFEKYVDLVFLVQNNLIFYIPKNETKKRFETDLEDFGGEDNIRYGMNIFLASKIYEMLHFEDTKQLFKERTYKLASNWDIDAVEMNKQKQKLEDTLFAHAKLQYSLENIVENYKINNVEVLAYLMSLYAKAVKIKKEKSTFHQYVKDISRTKFYRYVKEAAFEEKGWDIKLHSNLSLAELSNKIFDYCVEQQYLFDYPEEAKYFMATDEKFVKYKQEIEQDIIEETIEDLRKLPSNSFNV